MSDRDDDGQDYDYTKEIQQFKRIWKSYNQDGREEPLPLEHQETTKTHNPKHNPQPNPKPKPPTQKPSKPMLKKAKQSPERPLQTLESKSSPRSPNPNSQINIQTRVTQNKLKSAQLGHHDVHHHEIPDTQFRSSTRHLDHAGSEGLRMEVEGKNQEIALLRVSSNRFHDRIAHLEREIQKRDELIAELRHEQRNDKKEANKGREKEWLVDYGHAEYESLRKDVKRLLNMLKNTQEYRHFASLGLEDGSMRFLHETNKKQKTNLDVQNNNVHFCTCNKAFISEPGLWVPQNVYKYAKEFVRVRKGELTNAEVELLLYDLNKMWREREKSIVNSLNAVKAQEIGVYRRKIQNMTHKSPV